MELFIQPQLQLTALQRLRLLWRCLKQVNTAELNYNWKLISQEKEIKKECSFIIHGENVNIVFLLCSHFQMLYVVKG